MFDSSYKKSKLLYYVTPHFHIRLWSWLCFCDQDQETWSCSWFRKRQFLPAPLHFSSCIPQCYAKTKLSLLFFKSPKMHLNCIYFLHYGLWNPEKFGLTLLVKFWIHQSVIQNMHFTFKNPSFKKSFLDPPIRNRNRHSGFKNS